MAIPLLFAIEYTESPFSTMTAFVFEKFFFFEEFALLIMTMTTLHPIERISIRDCITAFMELLNKYRLELELDRKTLEEEQDEIDTILDEKKV